MSDSVLSVDGEWQRGEVLSELREIRALLHRLVNDNKRAACQHCGGTGVMAWSQQADKTCQYCHDTKR